MLRLSEFLGGGLGSLSHGLTILGTNAQCGLLGLKVENEDGHPSIRRPQRRSMESNCMILSSPLISPETWTRDH